MLPLDFYLIIAKKIEIDDLINLSMTNKLLYYGLKEIRIAKYIKNINHAYLFKIDHKLRYDRLDIAYTLGYLEYIKYVGNRSYYLPNYRLIFTINDICWEFLLNKYRFRLHKIVKNNEHQIVTKLINKGLCYRLNDIITIEIRDYIIRNIGDLLLRGIKYGNLNTIIYLYRGYVTKDTKIYYNLINETCEYNNINIEIVKWLYDTGFKPTTRALYIACRTGNLELIRWLNDKVQWTTDIYNIAKGKGHKHIVDWIEKHKPNMILRSNSEDKYMIGFHGIVSITGKKTRHK